MYAMENVSLDLHTPSKRVARRKDGTDFNPLTPKI